MPGARISEGRHPQTQTPAGEQPGCDEERGTERYSLIVKTLPPEKAEAETAQDARECQDKAASDWWLVALTGVLAIATIALVGVTGGLVWLGRRQLNVMKNSIAIGKESAEAAKEAAEAARDVVKLSDKTAERQLRAYICVDSADISFEKRDLPVARIVIKNFGQTPAYEVRYWSHILIERHPLAIELPKPTGEFVCGASILPPNGTNIMYQPREPPIPLNVLPLIGTTEGTIYVYGGITYKDIFGNARSTSYRLVYGGPEGGRGNLMSPDTDGNEAT